MRWEEVSHTAPEALPVMRYTRPRDEGKGSDDAASTYLGLHYPASHCVSNTDVFAGQGLTGFRGEAWGTALPAVAGW